jgi:hypothetical protein
LQIHIFTTAGNCIQPLTPAHTLFTYSKSTKLQESLQTNRLQKHISIPPAFSQENNNYENIRLNSPSVRSFKDFLHKFLLFGSPITTYGEARETYIRSNGQLF